MQMEIHKFMIQEKKIKCLSGTFSEFSNLIFFFCLIKINNKGVFLIIFFYGVIYLIKANEALEYAYFISSVSLQFFVFALSVSSPVTPRGFIPFGFTFSL